MSRVRTVELDTQQLPACREQWERVSLQELLCPHCSALTAANDVQINSSTSSAAGGGERQQTQLSLMFSNRYSVLLKHHPVIRIQSGMDELPLGTGDSMMDERLTLTAARTLLG